MLDRRYPLPLTHVQPIPPVLFVAGELLADEVGVSVVGSRDASVRGQQMASTIARGLVERLQRDYDPNICPVTGDECP